MKEKLYMFLDFDGVLNNEGSGYGDIEFEENSEIGWSCRNVKSVLELIETLEKHFELKVIVSSAWKLNKTFKAFKYKLEKKADTITDENKKKDVKLLISKFKDKTPDNNNPNVYSIKGEEVKNYLKEHNITNDKILVLDDEIVITGYDNEVFYHVSCGPHKYGLSDFDNEVIMIYLHIHEFQLKGRKDVA